MSISVSDVPSDNSEIWPANAESYELHGLIGVGACAVVHFAVCMVFERRCAIKKIKIDKWDTPLCEMKKYLKMLTRCDHENIAKCYARFIVQDSLWLVMKCLDGGAMLDVINYKMKVAYCKHGVFDEEVIATVLKEVLKGLIYIHGLGEIHRDIKASNILIDKGGCIQIGDVGVATCVAAGRTPSRYKSTSLLVGSPYFMAPEMLQPIREYNSKVDIWSLGITAIQLATGKPPYHKCSPMKAVQLTMANDPPNIETGSDERNQYKTYGCTFRKLLAACLQKNPSKRPSAKELMNHLFFKKAKDVKDLTKHLIAIGPSIETRTGKASMKKFNAPAPLRHVTQADWTWIEPESSSLSSISDSNTVLDSATIDTSKDAIYYNDYETEHLNTCGVYGADTDKLRTFNFVLKLRNVYGELIEVSFPVKCGVDTAESIAIELVKAALIDPRDIVSVSANLDKLIDRNICSLNDTLYDTVTFPLNSTEVNIHFDDKKLVGFAQLTLTL